MTGLVSGLWPLSLSALPLLLIDSSRSNEHTCDDGGEVGREEMKVYFLCCRVPH
jgi:hypothetical protein